jgi:predicted ATP-grasp superfamily ATP-dependent carboligase
VVSLALRAAELIGDGLYGVDLKQTEQGIYVIEINDNPSIDMGCEDAVLKDDLYRRILQEFVHRLDGRTPSANRGEPGSEPELPLSLMAEASD